MHERNAGDELIEGIALHVGRVRHHSPVDRVLLRDPSARAEDRSLSAGKLLLARRSRGIPVRSTAQKIDAC